MERGIDEFGVGRTKWYYSAASPAEGTPIETQGAGKHGPHAGIDPTIARLFRAAMAGAVHFCDGGRAAHGARARAAPCESSPARKAGHWISRTRENLRLEQRTDHDGSVHGLRMPD